MSSTTALLDVGPDLRLLGCLRGELGVVHDGGQQVVVVVGDPGGELAQAFQPFGLAEPVFQRPAVGFSAVALGDVAGHDRGPGHGAAGIADRGEGVGHLHDRVVFAQAAGLGLGPLAGAYSLQEGR